jgi:hypothetical protein
MEVLDDTASLDRDAGDGHRMQQPRRDGWAGHRFARDAGRRKLARGRGQQPRAGRPGPSYQAGAAKATVDVAGKSYPMEGGTCKQGSIGAFTFELVIGTVDKAPYLDVFVSDFSTAIHDGQYTGGTNLVTVQVETEILAVPATISLSNGMTAGTFSGTSAGNNPQPVSGSFTC